MLLLNKVKEKTSKFLLE